MQLETNERKPIATGRNHEYLLKAFRVAARNLRLLLAKDSASVEVRGLNHRHAAQQWSAALEVQG